MAYKKQYRKLKLREVVEQVLKEDERCRKDIKYLTYKVLRHYTKIFIPFQDFIKIPSFESIARCKRSIMNKEGKFSDEFIPEENVTYEKEGNILSR